MNTIRASTAHHRVRLWQEKMFQLVGNAPRPKGKIVYGAKSRRANLAIIQACAAILELWEDSGNVPRDVSGRK